MNLKVYFELGGELTEGQKLSNKRNGEVKFIKRNDNDSITIVKKDGVRWSVSNWFFWVDDVENFIGVKK